MPASPTGRARGRRHRRRRGEDRRGRAGFAAAQSYDAGGRLVCAGLVETHIHLDKSRIIDRCPPPNGRRRQPGDDGGAAEERLYRRGRAAARRAHARECTRQRHDADAHPARGRSGGRHARLRRGPVADRRLQMGDRHRDLRVSAGRADQLSRHRGAAGRGAEARRQGDRRGAALRQRPGGADRPHLRARPRVRRRHRHASRCRRRPPSRCTSIRCSS